MKPTLPLRRGVTSANDEAQDRAVPENAQLAQRPIAWAVIGEDGVMCLPIEQTKESAERCAAVYAKNSGRSAPYAIEPLVLADSTRRFEVRHGYVFLAPAAQIQPQAPEVAQLPHQTARLPHNGPLPIVDETPAELVRNAATLLALVGIGNRHFLTFKRVDVAEIRAKLAAAFEQLDGLPAPDQRFGITTKGRVALESRA